MSGALRERTGIILSSDANYVMKSHLPAHSADIWQNILDQARVVRMSEPVLAEYLDNSILNHGTLDEALAHRLVKAFGGDGLSETLLRETLTTVNISGELGAAASADITATLERDSACRGSLEVFLFYKGFIALQAYRLAHALWGEQRHAFALLLQSQTSTRFSVDIHPAATIGRGIMLDHATGIVIGETARIADAVSIMQSVTLGGTGKENGDRHPKIGFGVLIGPGAKILGNISVGRGAMIAASSVVLKTVPQHAIVAGVPARIVGDTQTDTPADAMNHFFKYNGV